MADTLASRLDRIFDNRKSRFSRKGFVDTPINELAPAERATMLERYLGIEISTLPDDRRQWIAGQGPLPAAVDGGGKQALIDWLYVD